MVRMTQRMKIAHATRIACLAAMLVSLASCGGGGGGGGVVPLRSLPGIWEARATSMAPGRGALQFAAGRRHRQLGNVYVGDMENHTVRKITPPGR